MRSVAPAVGRPSHRERPPLTDVVFGSSIVLRTAVASVLALLVGAATFASVLTGFVAGSGCADESIPGRPVSAADGDGIPAAYATLYRQAATSYAIPWSILAAIGSIETDHGHAGVETHELTETAVQLAAAGCAGLDVPAGEADLRRAEGVTAPRPNRPLPAWAMAPGRGVEVVDVRLYDDVLWLLRGYHLRVTAAREAGHHTHGDGTAVDLIPADGTTQGDWDASAGALARALGWRAECGSSGSRPACSLVPAIQFVGYDGYPGHGSPRTCGPGCPAHIHISWASPCYGTSGVSPPCEWVMAFSAPSIKGGDLVFDRTSKAQPSA